MNELYEVWNQDLKKAIEHAKAIGRYELADYLTLKASNDAIRKESIKWLFDSVLEIVFAFNRHGAKIKIEQKEKHRFKFDKRHLSGSVLRLQQGVRCLSIEAGWTQSPTDGIMRGGALAYANISHFGFKKKDEELVLLKYEERPQWFSIDGEKHRVSFNVKSFRKHFEVFLG
ncbi:MAG: hypothetical protein HKN25_01935 [Pyrinomonadaceae bacterium]|nr:hypothetical protein [Pyrinomonadaceae bacterium]